MRWGVGLVRHRPVLRSNGRCPESGSSKERTQLTEYRRLHFWAAERDGCSARIPGRHPDRDRASDPASQFLGLRLWRAWIEPIVPGLVRVPSAMATTRVDECDPMVAASVAGDAV